MDFIDNMSDQQMFLSWSVILLVSVGGDQVGTVVINLTALPIVNTKITTN